MYAENCKLQQKNVFMLQIQNVIKLLFLLQTEEQSDDSTGEDPEPTTFVGLPSDNEQPGPSGVGKATAGSDAP